MKSYPLLVKIFDEEKNFLCKGTLAKLTGNMIIVRGNYLPILPSRSTIIINIYNELSGISVYECEVSLATDMQLSANITKKHKTIERRGALKIRTDFDTPLRLVMRENKVVQITQPIIIKVLNLSIGGLRFTSSSTFFLGDTIVFTFDYYKEDPISLVAKIVRVEPAEGEFHYQSYGCKFDQMSTTDENIICKYLYERQLQLYKKK